MLKYFSTKKYRLGRLAVAKARSCLNICTKPPPPGPLVYVCPHTGILSVLTVLPLPQYLYEASSAWSGTAIYLLSMLHFTYLVLRLGVGVGNLGSCFCFNICTKKPHPAGEDTVVDMCMRCRYICP